jgi:long-chain acyl-CoA synthetase
VLSVPLDAIRRPHVVLAVLPLFHVLGLNTLLHLALLLKGSLVLADYRDGASTVDLIEQHQVTALSGPPNFWQALAAVPDVNPQRLSSVEIAVSGAAALPASVFLAVGDRLGIKLEEGYGLTETAATVASTLGTRAPMGTVGRLLPGVEGRVVDESEADALVGDPGELWVRGAMISPGYWTPGGVDRGPLRDDGWLPTGDLAMVDDFGHLAIVGRRKDMVIVSGFNVYPPEVERVLLSHPDVLEAGVVGEPSDTTGEAVVAFVVPHAGRDLDADELRQHCRLELARYKVPSRFVIAADLPIGPTGKLQRNRLQ